MLLAENWTFRNEKRRGVREEKEKKDKEKRRKGKKRKR